MSAPYYERVTTTENVRGADGRLLVQAGAAGIVCGYDGGQLDVLFDDGPEHVELSGCGRRFQRVPRILTQGDGMFYQTMGRRFRVLAAFPDTPEGEREANAYMLEHDGASVLEVAHGRVILAAKKDKGIPIKRTTTQRNRSTT